jgi:hypothetical protein
MKLPQDLTLPFFAYGAFKPNELAYSQIKEYLSNEPTVVFATGNLKVRDGLPLFDPTGSGKAQGFILDFSPETRKLAYEKICAFEPKNIYFWSEIKVETFTANVLQGKKMDHGRPTVLESNEWTFRLDPVFQHGLLAVQQMAEELADCPFESAPPESFDWPRFFRLQMAYLLLWSAVERFSSFAYGPALDPAAKVRAFGKDPRFLAAFERQVGLSTQEVSDSRDPGERTQLDGGRPDEAAAFYYQVRSNLSHRGKGAWSDGEIVRQSLRELLAIFHDMLHAT